MDTNTTTSTVETTEHADQEYDQYTEYEDDGALVICERKNPQAWIRSDATTSLDR